MENCYQCDGPITIMEEVVSCKSCKKSVHLTCAKAVTVSTTNSKFEKFVCRVCIENKQLDTASQGSDTLNEDSIKTLLTKLNYKYDKMCQNMKVVNEIQDGVNFLSDKYEEILKNQKEQEKLVVSLNKRVEGLLTEIVTKDKIIEDLSDRVSDLEQSQLANDIELCGIPVTNTDSLSDIVKMELSS